jgi:exonuclease III
MSANFEHITLNVNGLSSDDDTKFIKFIDKFKKSKYHARFTQEPRHKRGKQHPRQNLENACKYRNIKCLILISANTERSGGVASFWKRPPLDLHSDVVIEQLTKDTAQVSTVTITEMEIKICNLYAQ